MRGVPPSKHEVFTFHSPLSSTQMSPCRDTVSLCFCLCARVTLFRLLSRPCSRFALPYRFWGFLITICLRNLQYVGAFVYADGQRTSPVKCGDLRCDSLMWKRAEQTKEWLVFMFRRVVSDAQFGSRLSLLLPCTSLDWNPFFVVVIPTADTRAKYMPTYGWMNENTNTHPKRSDLWTYTTLPCIMTRLLMFTLALPSGND